MVGIWVDQMDHVWFLNRGVAAIPIELVAEHDPAALCCVRGPELIEEDPQGNVVNAWGGPTFHPKWPKSLQTVIVDAKGFVWVSGEANEDSILKFTHDGKQLVWDFDHRPPHECGDENNNVCTGKPQNNQETSVILNKGRFQLDETTNELVVRSHGARLFHLIRPRRSAAGFPRLRAEARRQCAASPRCYFHRCAARRSLLLK